MRQTVLRTGKALVLMGALAMPLSGCLGYAGYTLTQAVATGAVMGAANTAALAPRGYEHSRAGVNQWIDDKVAINDRACVREEAEREINRQRRANPNTKYAKTLAHLEVFYEQQGSCKTGW